MQFEGITYRSLLDARWACLLAVLGVPCLVYGPQGPVCPAQYLPSVWLPVMHHWLEILAVAPAALDVCRAMVRVQAEGTRVILVEGGPQPEHRRVTGCQLYRHDGQVLGAGIGLAERILAVLGLPEHLEAHEDLLHAWHHVARRVREQFSTDLEPVGAILRRLPTLTRRPDGPMGRNGHAPAH